MIKQFFFMLGIVTTAGFLLLIWDSPPESFLRPQAGKVDKLPSADSYMKNIKSHMFSASGDRQFTLRASKMSFFSDRAQLFLKQPTFLAQQAVGKSGELTVTADNGILLKNTQIFEFNGKVNANWESTEGQTQLKTHRLSYTIANNTAKASGGAYLKTPQTEITGDALSADFQTEIFTIESKVRAIHEPI